MTWGEIILALLLIGLFVGAGATGGNGESGEP